METKTNGTVGIFPSFRIGSRKRGFTLVELLVSMAVLAALSAVGIAYGNAFKSNQYNAKRLSDVETLKTAAESYKQAKGDYPEPKANSVRYTSEGAYRHSGTGAYGVSSTASSDLFGAEFLSEVPNDPETGAYYGYGKRVDGTLGYDFATVDRRTEGFYAYVRGNYDASALTSLVREYNGPGFVEDGKSDKLPYDPYKLAVSGRISSYSGTVSVNAGAKSVTGTLEEGDRINVSAGGMAMANLSDGTELKIGSATQATELKLKELSIADPKGFITKVRLALNGGEAWAKAPKLRDAADGMSELEMESAGAVASVRGTIFGVSNAGGATSKFMVAEGTIVIENASTGHPIANALSSTGALSTPEGGLPVTTDVTV